MAGCGKPRNCAGIQHLSLTVAFTRDALAQLYDLTLGYAHNYGQLSPERE